jgi:hypothetical protein
VGDLNTSLSSTDRYSDKKISRYPNTSANLWQNGLKRHL